MHSRDVWTSLTVCGRLHTTGGMFTDVLSSMTLFQGRCRRGVEILEVHRPRVIRACAAYTFRLLLP